MVLLLAVLACNTSRGKERAVLLLLCDSRILLPFKWRKFSYVIIKSCHFLRFRNESILKLLPFPRLVFSVQILYLYSKVTR